MKLVCDSCGTKYSIGDDRVAGKVFKIRCKKCSNVMVVRGAVEPAPSSPEPSTDPSGEWHAVVDGMQSGPFSRVELLRKHASGELDHETFVWREGLADWVALGTLEELRGSLAAPAEPTAVTAPVAEAPVAARLLAERNESSVLFTLGNLAKLATPRSARASVAPATASGTEGSGLIDIRALASSYAPAKSNAKAVGPIGSPDDLPVYAPTPFGEPLVLVPNARPKPDRRVMLALLATLAMLAVLAVVLVVVVLRKPDTAEAAVDPGTRLATLDPRTPGTNHGSPNAGPSNGTNHGASNAGTNGGTNGGTNPGTNTGTDARTSNDRTNAGTSNDGTNTGTNAGVSNGRTNTGTANHGTNTGTNSGTPNGSRSNAGTPNTGTRSTPNTGVSNTGRRTGTPNTGNSRTTPTLTPDKEPNACTDVACAFNNYKDDCCKVFQKGGHRTPTPTPTPVPTGELHENLDRAQLAAGIATIKTQSCGGKSSSRGDVNASVKVSAMGTVIGVTILSSPDPALSSCVTGAAQKGTFAKTKRGGSFKYVWRF